MLLLGNFMISLLKALSSAHETLNKIQHVPSTDNQDPPDAVHVFTSVMTTIVYALLGHTSDRSFWLHFLQPGEGKHMLGVSFSA